ncbi:MAG: T9SS type A sorting domain-containing protein [Ferruginibacter sp.]
MKQHFYISFCFVLLLQALYIQTITAQICQKESSQTDFLTGTVNNVDLLSSPGDITLPALVIDQQNALLSNTGTALTPTSYGGQTFTPAISGSLAKIAVSLFCSSCTGTTPDLVVEIKATAAAKPTGAALATGTIAGFNSGTAIDAVANFTSPATITAGTMYAIVIHPLAKPSAGSYAIQRSTGDVYAGGTNICGASSGTVWSIPLTPGSTDVRFTTYMVNPNPIAGDFTSQVQDAGALLTFSGLGFTANKPAGTDIKFQVAASNHTAGPFTFVGPDGTAASYFTNTNTSLLQFTNVQYIQYKAYLNAANGYALPTVNDVNICHLTTMAVKWLQVSGDINDQHQATFNWTIQETNTDRYIVQQSTDGKQFINVGTVASKGDGTKRYAFTDAAPATDGLLYRIQQVDKNGGFAYSPVSKLMPRMLNTVAVFPNPTDGMVRLNTGSNLLNTKAVITNCDGKIMLGFAIQSTSCVLNLSSYPAGIYILKLANGLTQKIIKR